MDESRILKGFHDLDYYTTICPVCGMTVCPKKMCKRDQEYIRHFNRCLNGRVFRNLLGGAIQVLPEDMEAEVCATVTKEYRIEPRNVWMRLIR